MGLESVTEQLPLFEGLSDAEQIVLLKTVLNNLEQLPIVFENMVQACLRLDLTGLVKIRDDLAQYGNRELERKFQEWLIDNRNRRMVDRILPLLEKGSLFVGLGALRLPGEMGIPSILQGLGYSVGVVY